MKSQPQPSSQQLSEQNLTTKTKLISNFVNIRTAVVHEKCFTNAWHSNVHDLDVMDNLVHEVTPILFTLLRNAGK